MLCLWFFGDVDEREMGAKNYSADTTVQFTL